MKPKQTTPRHKQDCLNALDVKVTEAQLNDVSNPSNKQIYRDIMEYVSLSLSLPLPSPSPSNICLVFACAFASEYFPLTNPRSHLLPPSHTVPHCRYLAEICTGITKEEIVQPQFNGLQALNHPELHEESIPYMHAFRAVTKMMNICGIHDFSTRDYLAPSAKRMRRQLSGIINFAKFREERFTLLTEISSERERQISTCLPLSLLLLLCSLQTSSFPSLAH